jgi:CHAD domain-containing protein
VTRLLVRLRERRRQSLTRSREAIARLGRRGVLAEIAKAAAELRAAKLARRADEKSPAVYRRARKRVLERLETMLSYEPSLARPGRHADHHAMRIAAKKLRYTLEALAPLYEETLAEAIVAATETQDGLGETHDCDVWANVLAEFLAEEKRHTEAYPGSARPMREILPGIRYLRRDRSAARGRAHAAFLARWKDIQRRGVWRRLVQLLETAGRAGGAGKTAGRPS